MTQREATNEQTGVGHIAINFLVTLELTAGNR